MHPHVLTSIITLHSRPPSPHLASAARTSWPSALVRRFNPSLNPRSAFLPLRRPSLASAAEKSRSRYSPQRPSGPIRRDESLNAGAGPPDQRRRREIIETQVRNQNKQTNKFNLRLQIISTLRRDSDNEGAFLLTLTKTICLFMGIR